ncbi:MAG TPA: methyltransferase domain-containing protein [Candidatus Goldiibacteriota bacterium]|nr:methyltransferase domain-containing protein [Candidatus Goldiibacteriota bacterium]HRQ43594.1 methyltransferase domain-containing protein [Candidatus Goldiibacteriota bacterium]
MLEIYTGLDRYGPGDIESTKRALNLCNLPENPKILDIGCGSGASVMCLAQLIKCQITAADNYDKFLNELRVKVRQKGVSGSISVINSDMASPDFPKESFDLIWCEGAIYNIGFENGLKVFSRFLKKGGYMAVTEIAWIKNRQPEELKQFWAKEYPAMTTMLDNAETVKRTGMELKGMFELGKKAWENYYNPLEARVKEYIKEKAGNEKALKAAALVQEEIDIYRAYGGYYDYVFYVMKK